MVTLVAHRVRIGRDGRLWLRAHGMRARPFKQTLGAFLRMDPRAIEVRVRHRWAEDVIRTASGEQPVVIDYGLMPTMVPIDLIREPSAGPWEAGAAMRRRS